MSERSLNARSGGPQSLRPRADAPDGLGRKQAPSGMMRAMAIRITGDAAADQVLSEDPFALLATMLLRKRAR